LIYQNFIVILHQPSENASNEERKNMFAQKRDYKGVFITLEGVEGSGKSSVIPILEKLLKDKYNKEIVLTREPGGTEISESIRELLFKYHDTMENATELLLFLAARSALVKNILTELYQGKIVIADRYMDSTYVYQGLLKGLDLREVFDLNSFATKNLNPDMTFAMLIPYEESVKRLSGRPDNGKYDNASEEEFNKIYEGYKTLNKMFPNRLYLIDSTKSPDNVAQDIMDLISKHKLSKSLL
jgi:dTMP kinase